MYDTQNIPLVRATHLNVYLAVMRDLGAPVDSALQRAKLPGTVEETPDAYLCVPQVLDCVSRLGGSAAAMELGFAAAKRSRLESLAPAFQRAIRDSPSGWSRLQAVVRYASSEDAALATWLVDEGDAIRVVCTLSGFERSSALAYSEWLQLEAIVSIVRSVAGETWTPDEITFVSGRELPAPAQDEFANTRILLSQPYTSLLVPRLLLGLPCACIPEPVSLDAESPAGAGYVLSLADTIREVLKPYLRHRPL